KPMPHVDGVTVTLSQSGDGNTGTISLETGVSVSGSFNLAAAAGNALASITGAPGTWSLTDFAPGKTIDVSGAAGGTFTIATNHGTTLPLNRLGLWTLPNLPGAAIPVKVLTLTGSNSPGSFLSDGFAVGQELALGPPTQAASSNGATYDIWESHLTLH